MTVSFEQPDPLLFLMRNPAYVRNFEFVLRALASDGHHITVLFEERKEGGDRAGFELIGRLKEEFSGLRYELCPQLQPGTRGCLRLVLEALQDYLRYFDAPYVGTNKLRSRALAILPSWVERALAFSLRRSARGRRALADAARRLNERLGVDPRIRGELQRRRPRAVIVTPMVHFRSRQGEWVRAARGLGIGTLLCVYSWDNLTSKGLMHATPDRIALWNQDHRHQAIELHGARPDSIVVTGAWPYDHWFSWTVSRSRVELCRELGLPPGRPLILYVCSSRFIAERERRAVIEWVRALRSSDDARVAGANILVRPHPLNSDDWADASLAGLPGAAVFPPRGADPVDDASRADYFDALAHADVVVGVNTSALIETTIVDRPAFALPADSFGFTQAELPHFRQLTGERGVVQVSGSMSEHILQLAQTIGNDAAGATARQRFVERFIRPYGDSPSPTERLVAVVEELLEETRERGSPGSSHGSKIPA